VRIAVVVLVLTQLMNLALVPWLGHAGLALSIGLAALINACWLLFGLHRRGTYLPAADWPQFAVRVLGANLLLGLALAAAAWGIDWVALGSQRLVRVGLLSACLAASAVLYFVVLRLTGVRITDFTRRG
jgi:putative peptidoglycan lipid II flippase